MLHLSALVMPGIIAVRRFYLPFLLVQLGSICIVIAYYRVEAFQNFCHILGDWKTEGGLLFAALSSALAGGILPEVAKALTGKVETGGDWKKYLAYVFWVSLMYVGNGIMVERFYWLQAALFGDEVSASVVLIKVLLDQFIFSPLIPLPYAVVYFLWLEEKRDWRRTWNRLSFNLLLERSLPLYICNLFYWIPMTLCIYSLPQALQFPLFLTALAAWSLIFITMAVQPVRPINDA